MSGWSSPEARRRWNQGHRSENHAAHKAWCDRNRQRKNELQRIYRLRHLAEVRERKRIYESKNPEKKRDHLRRWRLRHPGAEQAKSVRRRAAQDRATPAWANQAAIRAIYAEAARLSKTTGIPHHVDHIYPLRGSTVSGLHVEQNLQILTKAENLRKLNKHPDSLVAA